MGREAAVGPVRFSDHARSLSPETNKSLKQVVQTNHPAPMTGGPHLQADLLLLEQVVSGAGGVGREPQDGRAGGGADELAEALLVQQALGGQYLRALDVRQHRQLVLLQDLQPPVKAGLELGLLSCSSSRGRAKSGCDRGA